MDYRQLEVFRAVMDAGSATAAAQLLRLSQPAVSRQLAQMEAELGLGLFIRGKGRLQPTAEALALYDEASFAFQSLERVLNLASRMRGHDAGVLRLAVPFALGESLMPRIVASLARTHRQLRYAVELGRYETIAAMVAQRQVDVAILKQPLSHPGITLLPLVDCAMVCVMPTDHRLAARAAVAVDELSREELVLLGRDTAWRSDLQSLLRRSPRQPAVRVETHSAAAVCALVAQGLGVSVLPALLAAQFAGRGVLLRPLQAPITQRFVVGCPSGLQRSALVDEFVRAARKTARSLMSEAGIGSERVSG